MKTYTPDEYRQMAARNQFGKVSGGGGRNFHCFYCWLITYSQNSLNPFMVSIRKIDGGWAMIGEYCIFTPCEEPKELQG